MFGNAVNGLVGTKESIIAMIVDIILELRIYKG